MCPKKPFSFGKLVFGTWTARKQFFSQSTNTYLSNKKKQRLIEVLIFEINSLTFLIFLKKSLHNFLDSRFDKCLLARRDQKWSDFLSFGDTYLHLPRGRVQESLWKPHQSKAINFLHRNYVPTFFFNSNKKYFSSWSKIFFEKKSVKKYFRENFRKSKNVVRQKNRKFQNFDFRENFTKIFFDRFFFRKYFWSWRKIFFVIVEKKMGHSFDVENW